MVEASPLLAAGVTVALVLASIRRSLFRIAAVAATGLAISMIVESGELVPAAVAAAILGTCWAIGEAVRRDFGSPETPQAYRWAVSTPLGIALVSGVVFLLGILRILFPMVIATVLLALATVSIVVLRRRPPAAPRAPRKAPPKAPRNKARKSVRADRFPERFFLATMTGLVLLLQLPAALAPETSSDALSYHLPVPRGWLAAHAFISFPYWHSHLAHLAETFFVVPWAFAGEPAVKLVVYGVGLVLLAAAWALGDELFGRRAASWSAAILATTPIMGRLSTETQADTLVALFLAAAILSLTALLRSPEPTARRAALVFGLLSGAAVATKLNAAYAVVPLTTAWVILGVRRRVPPRAVAAGPIAMALVPLPWFAMTYRFTGSPVFPFLNGWFKSPLIDPVNRVMNAKLFGIGTAPSAWLHLPFAVTYETHQFGEHLVDGAAGFALLILPALFAVSKGRLDWRHGLAAAVVVGYGIGLGFTFQYVRYFTAVFPLIAALAAGAAVSLPSAGARRVALGAIGAALVGQTWLFVRESNAWDDPHRSLAFGDISAEQYRRLRIPGIECLRELDRNTGPLDRIAEHKVTPLHYFVTAPMDSPSESREFAIAIDKLSGERVRDVLWNRHDRFILIRPANGTWRPPYAVPAFLDRFAAPLCRAGGLRAYRLRPPGEENPRAAAEPPEADGR